jgi:hypothetical protein
MTTSVPNSARGSLGAVKADTFLQNRTMRKTKHAVTTMNLLHYEAVRRKVCLNEDLHADERKPHTGALRTVVFPCSPQR